MEFDQVINIVLTAIIAISVFFQAKYAKQQARVLIESEETNKKKGKPNVRIVLAHHSIQDGKGDTDSPKWVCFVGFTITNASLFDITITIVDFEVGIPENKQGSVPLSMQLTEITKYKGRELSNVNLPQRLKYGDTIKLLYNEKYLVESFKSDGDNMPIRVRPRCYDSLGNIHTLGTWVTWSEGRVTNYSDGPGPGLLNHDEWMASHNPKKHSWITWIKKHFYKSQQGQ